MSFAMHLRTMPVIFMPGKFCGGREDIEADRANVFIVRHQLMMGFEKARIEVKQVEKRTSCRAGERFVGVRWPAFSCCLHGAACALQDQPLNVVMIKFSLFVQLVLDLSDHPIERPGLSGSQSFLF
jgi:hypothetical protein